MTTKARFYESLPGEKVLCRLCAHQCLLAAGKRGQCGVRENQAGVLESLVWGKVVAENLDPIEKKPLFHVLPGSLSYSLATVGCNFHCRFCQNHEISQASPLSLPTKSRLILPEEIVRRAHAKKARSISYTYTEPTVFFEYARDIGIMARERGLLNIFVTNGYLGKEAIREASLFLDAANVDLKSFRDQFYREQCQARLAPVLDCLVKMKEQGIWVEVTTLIIPGLNDSTEELRDLARFLHSLGSQTPWHISRFYPRYRLGDFPPTSADIIHRAWDIGREAGLEFVYAGNLPGDPRENTLCPQCHLPVIERRGYQVCRVSLSGGSCMTCGKILPGIF
jgi:pyruvate formate lyase activating enzyme